MPVEDKTKRASMTTTLRRLGAQRMSRHAKGKGPNKKWVSRPSLGSLAALTLASFLLSFTLFHPFASIAIAISSPSAHPHLRVHPRSPSLSLVLYLLLLIILK